MVGLVNEKASKPLSFSFFFLFFTTMIFSLEVSPHRNDLASITANNHYTLTFLYLHHHYPHIHVKIKWHPISKLTSPNVIIIPDRICPRLVSLYVLNPCLEGHHVRTNNALACGRAMIQTYCTLTRGVSQLSRGSSRVTFHTEFSS